MRSPVPNSTMRWCNVIVTWDFRSLGWSGVTYILCVCLRPVMNLEGGQGSPPPHRPKKKKKNWEDMLITYILALPCFIIPTQTTTTMTTITAKTKKRKFTCWNSSVIRSVWLSTFLVFIIRTIAASTWNILSNYYKH